MYAPRFHIRIFMAFYNYWCPKECKLKQLSKELRDKLTIEKHPKGRLVWTERHSMDEKPEIKCPVCATVSERTWHGTKQQGWIRGQCYLNRADAKRHMDLRVLESGNDPYGHMRQAGEVDDLKSRLRKKKVPKK